MRRPRVCLCTDPGPDPDDAKVILLLGLAHLRREVNLIAVICNGGGQARERACLARCLLDHLGAQSVPVGIGSQGVRARVQPHEYTIVGFHEVNANHSRLADGADLLFRALHSSPRKSVRLLLISSMRDVADLLERDRALVLSRVQSMVIQGGVTFDEATGRWVADTAVNNTFDMQAANAVYAACQQSDLPMTVVSRHAVPLLPMQLANSFVLRTDCPVMRYLANAQDRGLVALWGKVCACELPKRCTKQWFFETFCGVSVDEFVRLGLDRLGGGDDIGEHLNGFVKPNDVIAAMGVLDETAPLLREAARRTTDPWLYAGKHTLLLEPQQALEAEHVITLLRTTYHEIVEITAAPQLTRATSFGHIASVRASRLPANDVRLSSSYVQRSGSRVDVSAFRERDMRVQPLRASPQEEHGIPRASHEQVQARQKALPTFACVQGCAPYDDDVEEYALRAALRAARTRARDARRDSVRGNSMGSADSSRTIFCAPKSPSGMDAVGEAVAQLLALSEQRVFAHLRTLSMFALGWGVCSFVSLLSYFLLSGRLVQYDDDGTRWVMANSLVTMVQASLILSMLFVPAIDANLGSIRGVVSVTLLSCSGALSTMASFSTALFTRQLRKGALPLWHGVFGARAVEANMWYLGIHSSFALLMSVGCSAALLLHWRMPERLVACFWRWWAFFTLTDAAVTWLMSILMHVYGIYPARSFVVMHAIHVFKLCAGLFAASHWARSQVQARISRALANRASFWCSLAALSGVGGLRDARLPQTLVEEATRSFGAHARPLPVQSDDDEPLCALLSSGGKFMSGGSSLAAEMARGQAEPVAYADAYVLHAPPRDEAGAHHLATALRAWASRFEQTHSRPPVVYAEAISHDVSLEPLERLQHMPLYLARSGRLLILLTREIFDDARRVGVCTAWAALGCGVDEIDVEIAEGDSFSVSVAVGALDAFKAPAMQATLKGKEDAATRAARFAFELTGEALVRRTIYSILPLCVEAAKGARARNAACSTGRLSAISEVPSPPPQSQHGE